VDERFGRCRCLLITDGKKVLEALEEPSLGQNGGAGVTVAQAVVRSGVRSLIGAEPGPKAMQVLRLCNIEVYVAKGMKAEEALEAFRHGSLRKPEEPVAECTEDVVLHGRPRNGS
jgi:predicted Fe-Mo cluster-binding NifX family protein